jgi:hypothetical protein
MVPQRYSRARLLALLLILACAASPAGAGVITLDKLLAGGQVESGGLVFSKFTYDATGPGIAKAANVNVTGVVVNGEPGLQFDGLWTDGPNNPGIVPSARISYLVTAKGPTLIAGAHLVANPTVTPTKAGTDGLVTVEEKFALNCPG